MKKMVIFGAGITCEKTWLSLPFDQYELVEFWDNSDEKNGKLYKGKVIRKPYPNANVDLIYVASVYYEEIVDQLLEMGYDLNIIKGNKYFEIEKLKEYYKQNPEENNSEIEEVFEYVDSNGLKIFNYPFADEVENINFSVEYDNDKEMYYVLHYGKKMFFKKSFNNEERIKRYYAGLIVEQNIDSPHRYLTPNFYVEDNDVVIDCGVAEGNFALEIIDKVSKIYLVECDLEWVEALKATFEPWQEKVVIVSKFLSDHIDGDSTTIDEIIHGDKANFIKMDIEGAEELALKGAEDTLARNNQLKLALCTYHTDEAYTNIYNSMISKNFSCETSKGYMYFDVLSDENALRYKSIRLRRGIIRARKL